MPPTPASPPPVIRLTDRQEAFCQAMACNTGGAEAARRAGYSAAGAKQRGAFLMRQPEIRIRIDQIRSGRRTDHQTLLDDAAVQVEAIVTEALEKKSCGLALRAIEFRLKLRGVIQDRRIAHHYHLDQRHPDADLEHLDADPEEEMDALHFRKPGKVLAPPAPAASRPGETKRVTQTSKPCPIPLPGRQPQRPDQPRVEAKIVTRNDDLSRLLPAAPKASSLFASTALSGTLTGPMPRYHAPAAA